MMKKVLTAAVTAALFGIASVSWAQGAGGAGGGTSGGAGGGGASPGSSSNAPGAAGTGVSSGTSGSASGSGSIVVPTQCAGMVGLEKERCVTDNRVGAGTGASSDRTPTHPGDAAKGDTRYNSPATGTGAHSVPGSQSSGSGAGTRQ